METADDEDREARAPSAFVLELPAELVEAAARRAAEIVGCERRFLSKPALAEHLGVTERRVKTLREAGLPARKIGRDLYFDVDEVNLWLDREGR
jgi:hypothetical protein